MLLAGATFNACGGSDESDGIDPAVALEEEFDKRLIAATDVRKLQELRIWARTQITENPDHTTGLEARMPSVDAQLVSDFEQVARQAAAGGQANAVDALLAWINDMSIADASKPEVERDPLVARLKNKRTPLLETKLRLEPDNDELRRELGFTQITDDLGEFDDGPYLEDDDIEEIARMKAILDRETDVTKSGKRWARARWKSRRKFESLIAKLDDLKGAHEDKMDDPWEKRAAAEAKAAQRAVREALENDSYSFDARTFRPYLILVERDSGWKEGKVAKEKANALTQLYETFYGKYRNDLNLKDITDDVVPVVLFRKMETYRLYAQKRGADSGAVGHFEGSTGRLMVNEGTSIDTIFHEGTHQLIHFNTKKNQRQDGPQKTWAQRSYWFEEGVAEYFGGNHRFVDKDRIDGWGYEIGLLHIGRIEQWRKDEHKAFKLWDLLSLKYTNRESHKATDNEDLNLFAYSQGWFLVYFLEKFKLEKDGYVVIGENGKYRDRWIKYFRGELEGYTGRQFFLECMELTKPDGSLDQAKYDAFEAEFLAYFEWVNRKIAMKQVKDRKFVPWNEVVNKRGQKYGEREDDLLVEPKRQDDDTDGN